MTAKKRLTTNTISLADARHIALSAQLLSSAPKAQSGKKDVLKVIDRLGYIQLDTIAVVECAHHHTLWTRIPGYNHEMLHTLQAKDRKIFEYWAHAQSYLPMTDYPYYLPKMHNFRNPKSQWFKNQQQKYGHLIKPVLDRIRTDGPMGSKDFESASTNKKTTWGNGKPVTTALNLLFWRGELMISERRNFHKIYDLTERVLPPHINRIIPHKDEIARFHIKRALTAFGIASEKEIRQFLQPDTVRDFEMNTTDKNTLANTLRTLLDSGEIISLFVDKNTTPCYADSALFGKYSRRINITDRLFILSPFDNLVIQRNRLKQLFDFDYSIECYLPPEKRKYGFFSLPLLWHENMIGRIDIKADRAAGIMHLINLVFEPSFNEYDAVLSPLIAEINNFARFNNCSSVKLQRVSPQKIKSSLNTLIKSS